MTFPFSTHNYQLRFWMRRGGVDPDEDVHLVVLPPPYMVDSLAMGMSMRSASARPGIRSRSISASATSCIFVSDILVRAAEKVLAIRQSWSDKNPESSGGADPGRFTGGAVHRTTRKPHRDRAHLGKAGIYRRRCRGDRPDAGRPPEDLTDGSIRESNRYLLVGREGAARPDPVQAAWLYAQMVRWGQTAMRPDALKTAMAVFRPDLYDAAMGQPGKPADGSDAVGAFAGPAFNPDDIAGHLAAFKIGHWKP